MKKTLYAAVGTVLALSAVGFSVYRCRTAAFYADQHFEDYILSENFSEAPVTNSPDTTLVAQAWSQYNRGAELSYKGNNQAAISYFTELLRLAPDAINFYNRGIIVALSGDPTSALADFDQAIARDPKLAVAYYFRGNVRYDLGDRQGALSDYQQAVALEPATIDGEDEHGFYARGLAQGRLGNQEAAQADLEMAAQISQRHSNTTFLRQIDAAMTTLSLAVAP